MSGQGLRKAVSRSVLILYPGTLIENHDSGSRLSIIRPCRGAAPEAA